MRIALTHNLRLADTEDEAEFDTRETVDALAGAIAQHGVPTPRWQYVDDPRTLQLNALRYPVIVKPNFEGSSKGITQESVVEDPLRLPEAVAAALTRRAAGCLA